jgi:hypothetical protein
VRGEIVQTKTGLLTMKVMRIYGWVWMNISRSGYGIMALSQKPCLGK